MSKKQNTIIPADVPKASHATYKKNLALITKGTNNIMLFAGDQKVEHLNDDFYNKHNKNLSPEDADPEHMFKIAQKANIGCFATQFGLIARYGPTYPTIPYIVKLNAKTNIVKTKQKDPLSKAWITVQQALELKQNANINVVGIGYTVYLGSEQEAQMLTQASQFIREAHKHGLIAIIWMYPRGKAVKDEKDPTIIAGAAGVAACLGADFVKVNYPVKSGVSQANALKVAVAAAGRTGVIVAGGSHTSEKGFLKHIHDQIHISGARGNATGRNIHQKSLSEAIKFCKAIAAITYENKDLKAAEKLLK